MTENSLTESSKYPHKSNFFSDFISLPFDHFENNKTNVVLIFGSHAVAENFRKCSDLFFNHFKNIIVFDGGHIINTNNIKISSIYSLIEHNYCKAIFIGFDNKFISLLLEKSQFSLCHIGNSIKTPSTNFNLDNTSFVGYQRHLNTYDTTLYLENNTYKSISLGTMRTYPSLSEAILRDTQLSYLNLNVLKWSECGLTEGSLPTGMTTEELCQIGHYLGGAPDLKGIFIDGGQLLSSSYELSLITAEFIWYYLEGLNMKSCVHPSESDDFSEFLVVTDNIDIDIVFLKNNTHGHWWIKAETENTSRFMACTHEEYQSTLNDEIPDRILKFINSLI